MEINSMFNMIVNLLSISSPNTITIILDNIISFYDVDPSVIDRFNSKKLFIGYLRLFKTYSENIMVSGIMSDIFERIILRENYQIFLSLFIKYIYEFLVEFQDNIKHIDHLSNILDLLVFSSINKRKLFEIEFILEKLMNKIFNLSEPRFYAKLTILLKNLILFENMRTPY